MSKAIVFLADGVEECEGLLAVDLMRRAGIEVTTVSIGETTAVRSSHGIELRTDMSAAAADFDAADALVLPGGLAGTANLAASSLVREQCLAFYGSRRLLAAICAAPSILASLGLLEGKQATVHPNFEEKMQGAVLTHTPVACDGNIVTGRSLAASVEFSLELVRRLAGEETAEKVARGICLSD